MQTSWLNCNEKHLIYRVTFMASIVNLLAYNLLIRSDDTSLWHTLYVVDRSVGRSVWRLVGWMAGWLVGYNFPKISLPCFCRSFYYSFSDHIVFHLTLIKCCYVCRGFFVRVLSLTFVYLGLSFLILALSLQIRRVFQRQRQIISQTKYNSSR